MSGFTKAFFGLLVLIVLATLAWWAYWIWMAGNLRTEVEAWARLQSRSGVSVTYDDLRVSGFPYRFTVEAGSPVVADTASGEAWSAERLQVTAMAWQLNHFIVRAPGRHDLQLSEGQSVSIELGTKAASSLVFQDGRLSRFSLVLPAPVVEAKTGARAIMADLEFYLRPMPDAPENGQIAFSLGGATLSSPPENAPWLGTSIEGAMTYIEFENAFKLLSGEWSYVEWTAARSRVKIAKATLDWGPLHAGAKGDFKLGPSGDPDGIIQVRLDDADTLKAALVEAGAMTDDLRAGITALELFSRDGGFAPFIIEDREVKLAGQVIYRY